MSDIDDPSVPREPRSIWHDALLVLAVLILVGTQFMSDRPLGFVNRPIVDDVAALPAKADQKRYSDYIWAYTYLIPKMKRPNALNFAMWLSTDQPDSYKTPPPRVGYSAREVDAFGMPFFAYKEVGYVLYFDTWADGSPQLYAAPMDDAGLEALRKETGSDVGKGWIFPFWAHVWGWIPLLLAAAWGWLQWRRMVRRRERLGIL